MNLVDIYRLMRNAHIQAQSIVDTIPEPLLVLDSSLCIEAASRSFYDTFRVNQDETLGHQLYDVGNGQWNIPDLRRLLEDVIPKSTAIVDYEVTHDFQNVGRRTMLISAHRLFQLDISSHSMLLSIVDATGSRKRDAESQILVGELRHRIKNLLAMVQAIARQTVTEGRSGEQYRDDFLGRFSALVAAHELAFVPQSEIELRTLIEQTLKPYGTGNGRVVAEPGPVVALTPVQIVPLSLIFHELATNAVKHGALSAPEGLVQINWEVPTDRAPQLHLRWRERGGPPVKPPANVGFGMPLIDFVVSRELGGRVELQYLPIGLTAIIVIPTP